MYVHILLSATSASTSSDERKHDTLTRHCCGCFCFPQWDGFDQYSSSDGENESGNTRGRSGSGAASATSAGGAASAGGNGGVNTLTARDIANAFHAERVADDADHAEAERVADAADDDGNDDNSDDGEREQYPGWPAGMGEEQAERRVFESATIVLQSSFTIAQTVGLPMSATDACHFYRTAHQGVLLVHALRDSNNQLLDAALSLAPIENSTNYGRFGTTIYNNLNEEQRAFHMQPCFAMISDKHKGLPAFMRVFDVNGSNTVHCSRHIMGNARAKPGCGKFPDELFWELQGATTSASFDSVLLRMRQCSPVAADHFAGLPAGEWAFYALDAKGKILVGHRTSNIVESSNSRMEAARQVDPLDCMHRYVLKYAATLVKRTAESLEWINKGEVLVPFAAKL